MINPEVGDCRLEGPPPFLHEASERRPCQTPRGAHPASIPFSEEAARAALRGPGRRLPFPDAMPLDSQQAHGRALLSSENLTKTARYDHGERRA